MYRFLDDRQKVNMVIYFINKDNYDDDELKPEKRSYIDTEKIMSKNQQKSIMTISIPLSVRIWFWCDNDS